MAIKVAVIGECMIELSENRDGIVRHFGGDTLNTAVYLTRANPDVAVHYVSALGTDPMSSAMLAQWQQEGVHTELVQRLDHKLPGLYLIETDERGERTFHYWRNDAAARYWLQTPKSGEICRQLQAFDYLYLSGISLAILSDEDRQTLLQRLAECRASGVRIVFDNNYRPRLWESREAARQAYRAMLALTDIAFLTLDDEFALWGDSEEAQCLARTRELGVEEIVIKRGAAPCLIVQQAYSCEVPAVALVKECVIDTTAAGDSFSAGYLAARLAGQSPADSARYAHLLASTVIQHRGAIIPLTAMPPHITPDHSANEASHVDIA
ncbi:2-dehydro-3-deoxygluconokinase [Aeromonas enteropelogenes]|uniref:sugar kinase n=1 Tax=Aeromonas enteropelogenes TaxID=29489 RepID=UPI0039886A90